MNIGVDIRCLLSSKKTGVARYTEELLTALFKIDKANSYYLFFNSYKDFEDYLPHWEGDNIHFVKTNFPNKIFNFLTKVFVWPKLDKLVIRRVSKNKIKNIDYWFSPNLSFTSLSKNTKHILLIHDLSFEFLGDCYTQKRRLWHRVLNPKKQCQKADLVLVPSHSTKSDLLDLYKLEENKVKILTPGLSNVFNFQFSTDQLKAVSEKYNLPDKFIFFLGTLEPRKNIIAIVKAFEKYQNKHSTNYKLIIAGPKGWKYNEIMKLIFEIPGAEYVDYIEEKDKPLVYKLSSLFVFPSLYEGFGFPVLEAMASGLPVVTSNLSSLPQLVDDSASLVNPHNITEISQAIETLLEDKELRDFYIKKGFDRSKNFDWDKTSEEFLSFLKSN